MNTYTKIPNEDITAAIMNKLASLQKHEKAELVYKAYEFFNTEPLLNWRKAKQAINDFLEVEAKYLGADLTAWERIPGLRAKYLYRVISL